MAPQPGFSDMTFLGRESRLARWFALPVKRFLAVEAAGGVLLLIATAVALIWVNSPWGDTYDDLWNVNVNITVSDVEIFAGHTLVEFVNDALMAMFFFVVGLEIKLELVSGALKNRRDAALPAFAALGGMIVPAALYFAINAGRPGQHGWGIPMATDIAFAVGILSLLGNRIPRSLKVILLSLAIVDDIGAILVIAVFYTTGIDFVWLAASAVLLGLVLVMRRLRIWYIPLYVLVGSVIWWTTFRSGVHATIAGVALGLIAPARPLQSAEDTRAVARWLRDKPEVFPVDVRYAGFRIRESISVAERLATAIHPISSYAIIPLFALANAGVRMNGDIISAALSSPVAWGIIIGLVVGKTVGVTLFSLIATRLKFAQMPASITLRHLIGMAMIAGIGFTVSLFVSNLAFTDAESHGDVAAVVSGAEPAATSAAGQPEQLASLDNGETLVGNKLVNDAKIGILAASVLASAGGLLLLSGARVPEDPDDE